MRQASAELLSSPPAKAHPLWRAVAAALLLLIVALGLAVERSGELRLGEGLVLGSLPILFWLGSRSRASRVPFSQNEDGCVVGPVPVAFPLAGLGSAAMMMIGALLVVHVQFVHPEVLRGSGSGRLVGYSILVALGAPYVLCRALVTAVQRPKFSIQSSGVSRGDKALPWSAVGDFEVIRLGLVFVARVKSSDGRTKFEFWVPTPDTPEGQAIERLVTRFWGRPPNYPKGSVTAPRA